MTGKRTNISSGAPWEASVGYSRAVRIGNIIEVAGTTAVDENGQIIGLGDPYTQARYALTKIETALQDAGARMEDVVRTRMFVTNIDHWKHIGRAHGEIFGDIRPAATLLAVKALITPGLLVEIEATAVLPEWPPESET